MKRVVQVGLLLACAAPAGCVRLNLPPVASSQRVQPSGEGTRGGQGGVDAGLLLGLIIAGTWVILIVGSGGR